MGSFKGRAGTQLLAMSSVEKGPEISDTGAPAISGETERGKIHSCEGRSPSPPCNERENACSVRPRPHGSGASGSGRGPLRQHGVTAFSARTRARYVLRSAGAAPTWGRAMGRRAHPEASGAPARPGRAAGPGGRGCIAQRLGRTTETGRLGGKEGKEVGRTVVSTARSSAEPARSSGMSQVQST